MKKTANLLAEAHVAVYPVDVRGLKTEATFLASNSATNSMSTLPQSPGSATPIAAAARSSGGAGGIMNTAPQAEVPMAKLTHESRESQELDQSTVNQIAQDTGGKAFYNTNGVKEAIQTAVEQGSEYYMLSYTPSNHNYDGRLRKISVALADRGYHLAYRRGYFADDPFSPLKQEKDALAHDVGVGSMQHGSPQAHQILFATRVIPIGKPVKADASKQAQAKKEKGPVIAEVQHYSVDYAIAASQLQFSVEGETHHGAFDFMASSFDDDGKALSRTASRIVADLKLGTIEIPLPVPPPPDEPAAAKARRALPEIEPD